MYRYLSVAGQLGYNVLKKTINLTDEDVIIAPENKYGCYLLSVSYSSQSSLFFIGYWSVIVVKKDLANNLTNIQVNIGVGNGSIYMRSTAGVLQNLTYSLIRL